MSSGANLEQAQRILLTLRPHLARPELELRVSTRVLQRHPLARRIGSDHLGMRPCCKPLAALCRRVDLDHHAGRIAARIAQLLTRYS